MFETLTRSIDLYCERTGPEFWSEPVNALTNLAFVVAGLWGVVHARRSGAGSFAEVLGWWVVAIGIGSGLFHTFANEATKWADIIPIAGFTLAYTLYNLTRFMRMPWAKALPIFLAFYVAVGILTAMVPDWLRLATNGSTGYLPPFLALIFFGILVIRSGNPVGWFNIVAAGLFILSVTFRAIDPVVCGSFPLGTHFLWHSLNGLMLGVLLAATVRGAVGDAASAGSRPRAGSV